MATKISNATKAARRVRKAEARAIGRQIQDLNLAWVTYQLTPEQYVPRHRELVAAFRQAQTRAS